MAMITPNDLRHLLNPMTGNTCVSLYMPTHMTWPESEQNPILFKNLLKELETTLVAHFRGRDFKPVLADFQQFQNEDEFWKTRKPALAMFHHAGHLHVYDLPRAVPIGIHMAESFHLKPVFRILQTSDRFNILTLGRHSAHLFEASRDSIIPLKLNDLPSNPKTHDTGARTRVGVQHFSAFGGSVVTIHDVDEKRADADFFTEVDHYVTQQLTNQNHLPLVLVALAEHQGTFRKISHNPKLLEQGVPTSPEHMPLKDLRDQALAFVEQTQHALVRSLVGQVEAAQAHGKSSTDLAEVARAAVAGRISTILVDADKSIGGRLSPDGQIVRQNQDNPDVDDLLDDLMETVFLADGTVHVLPSGLMPLNSGVAALFRY